MSKRKVTVSQTVEVCLDEAKFTPEFMAEFRESFFPFYEIEDHAKHIAQLYARGIFGGFGHEFIEGYGLAKDMGISAEVIDSEIDCEEGEAA